MRSLYRPPAGKVQIMRIPEMQFIMIDGKGDPAGVHFQEGISAMYNLAYTLKFEVRGSLKKDYPVMALEGLCWTEGGDFELMKRDKWLWTLMIMQPSFVTKKLFVKGVEKVKEKKNPPRIELARLERFDEGLRVQTTHIGPYADEAPTIARLDAFVRENGYRMAGRHHEIYLGDPRRASPSKLKTVIRHPVAKMR